jgi:deoxyribonuclease-4
MLLGSHLSTAGGLHHALEAARGYGFDAVALFVRSPRQWRAPPLSAEAVATFKETRERCGIRAVVAHANYLYNLAGAPENRKRSVDSLADELTRCAELGIEFLVLHPGSNPDPEAGLRLIAAGLDEAMAEAPEGVRLLIEGTAGQGNTLGHRFEHLARILESVRRPARFAVCLDTCHLFAAGYDLRAPEAWAATLSDFDRRVGLRHLLAWHCNDSLKPFASRRDRHAHIGEGALGREAFRNLVNDPRFTDTPLILETPKEKRESDGRDWDEINAETLCRLRQN